MKVMVFGNGWLGNIIAEHFDGVVSSSDILDTESVMTDIIDYRPDVVVNAAGKCGKPNIDWCESTPENMKLTTYVNTYGPVILYRTVSAVSDYLHHPDFATKFVHLSSGCLWEFGEDLDENTVPCPPSHYSKTKADGEKRLPHAQTLILRLRMPVSCKPHPRNLITKLLGYDKVINIPNSVTVIEDFLQVLDELIIRNATGVYNVVNSGSVSAAQIMTWYRQIVDPEHEFGVCDMDFLSSSRRIVAGRSNVTLSTRKLTDDFGITLRSAEDRIVECLKEYAKHVRSSPTADSKKA